MSLQDGACWQRNCCSEFNTRYPLLWSTSAVRRSRRLNRSKPFVSEISRRGCEYPWNTAVSPMATSVGVMMPSPFASLHEYGRVQYPLSGYPGFCEMVVPMIGGMSLPVGSLPNVTSLFVLCAPLNVTSQANWLRDSTWALTSPSKP